MPKVKFDISAKDLEETEAGGFDDYDGELLPTPGWYPLDIDWIKLDESKSGNDMLVVHMTFNNPDDDPELADYVGCPVWDRITILSSTLFKVKPFLDAIGATYKGFTEATVVDGEEPPNITKIGSLKISNLSVRCRLKLEVDDSGTYDDKLRPVRYTALADDEAPARPAKKAAKKAARRAEPEPEPEDDEEYEEEEPAPPRKTAKKAAKKAPAKKATRRRAEPEPEDYDDEEEGDEAPF